MLFITLVGCAVPDEQPKEETPADDRSFFVLHSESMSPAIKLDEKVYYEEIAPENLQVGDVIVYRMSLEEDAPVTAHRIIKITEVNGEVAFLTKGDNVEMPDSDPILPAQILGIADVN